MFQSLWPMSKWALLGSLIGWSANNSYLFISSLYLNLAATADLNSSRILLMPIGLTVVAWSKIARPKISELIHQKKWALLDRKIIKSIIGVQIITWVYILFIYEIFHITDGHLMGDKYINILPLVFWWGVYFSLASIRNIYSTYLEGHSQFFALFSIGLTVLTIQWLITGKLITQYGVAGNIWTLCVMEFLEIIIFKLYLIPKIKRSFNQ
jgi:O-antigen/teichoic acid export membrane protein